MKLKYLIHLILIISCQQPSNSVMNEKQNTISEFKITTGNPDFRGQYSIDIKPQNALLTFVQGEVTIIYSVDKESIYNDVNKKIQTTDPTGLKSSISKATPGDEKISFTIIQNGDERSSSLWLNEQWTNQELKSWFEVFKSLVKTISEGKMEYK